MWPFGRLGNGLVRFAASVALVSGWMLPHGPFARPRFVTGINVTSLADPGNGVCDEAECTLREAINTANASPGPEWLKIVNSGTILLGSSLPVITDDLTIDATDRISVIDGAGAYRPISTTAPLTLTSITIQNGRAATSHGGGAYFGATAVLSDVTFSQNSTGATGLGGGAYFAAPAVITDSVFVSNGSGSAGGAYFQSTAELMGTSFLTNTAAGGSAGGASFQATASVTNAAFVGNHSASGAGGGAILIADNSLVTASLFEANSSGASGGGLAIIGGAPGAAVHLSANHLWHNSAAVSGGGLFLDSGAYVSLDNSVLAANSVQSPSGAAEIGLSGAGSHLAGRHNTLASAAASTGTAATAGFGALGQALVLTNTIFHGYAVGVSAGPSSPNMMLDGVLWSSVLMPVQGNGISVSQALTGSALFTSPSLRNYHLTSASAAIDKGVSTGLSLDFEGDPRVSGLAPDLGADEYTGVPAAAPVAVDDTASTLEDTSTTVIVLANDSDPNNDTLTITGVSAPSSGQATLSGLTSIIYTPTLNFAGTGVFTYSVTDNVFTSTARVTVTILPVNDPPTISDVSDVTVTSGFSTGALPFTVSDVESGGLLTVTAASDNLVLVPNGHIGLSGSTTQRTVNVTAVAGQGGAVTITLTVSDDHGATAASSFLAVFYHRVLLPAIRR